MVARWPLLKEDNLPKKKVSTMSPNTCKECPRSAHVHDLAQLLTVLEEEGSTDVPDSAKEAGRLTRFAVFTRYPGAASCWPGGIRGSATARGRSGRMGRKRAWLWKRFLSARPSLLLLPPEGRKEPLSKKGTREHAASKRIRRRLGSETEGCHKPLCSSFLCRDGKPPE